MDRKIYGERVHIMKKLFKIAVPLAIADDVKAGISTTENLMVPKRLTLYPGQVNPLGAFGMVCGMVFPVLMFPAAILFGLAELLIPEMARCSAAGSTTRIRYLSEQSLRIALLYGCFCCGILFLSAESLCIKLYKTPEASRYLKWYTLLAPMLYCDAIVDAMNKGLGQQKISVRYNIITSVMDVIFLFFLLPKYGMSGYYFSFLVTHLVNFLLSVRLLKKSVKQLMPWKTVLICITALAASIIAAQFVRNITASSISFLILYAALLSLLGIISKDDLHWIIGVIHPKTIN